MPARQSQAIATLPPPVPAAHGTPAVPCVVHARMPCPGSPLPRQAAPAPATAARPKGVAPLPLLRPTPWHRCRPGAQLERVWRQGLRARAPRWHPRGPAAPSAAWEPCADLAQGLRQAASLGHAPVRQTATAACHRWRRAWAWQRQARALVCSPSLSAPWPPPAAATQNERLVSTQ